MNNRHTISTFLGIGAKKTLPLVAGLAGTLFVSGAAHGGFLGLSIDVTQAPQDPRLVICRVFVVFSDASDTLNSLNGLPAAVGPGLFFTTNSVNGFHQEQFFGGDRNFAVSAGELGAVPAMANDTYFNVGIRSGETTLGGVASGTADDYSASTPDAGITFGWNLGGKSLFSDPINGGTFDLVDLVAPITDQNIAGQSPNGNSIFVGQMVIDVNRPTHDGQLPVVSVQIGNLIWEDAAGITHLEGFDPDTGLGQALTIAFCVPSPGTLALLGLAGLAGGRRRRR